MYQAKCLSHLLTLYNIDVNKHFALSSIVIGLKDTDSSVGYQSWKEMQFDLR